MSMLIFFKKRKRSTDMFNVKHLKQLTGYLIFKRNIHIRNQHKTNWKLLSAVALLISVYFKHFYIYYSIPAFIHLESVINFTLTN